MIVRTMLIASEGHMLTDGTTYGKVIIPAEGNTSAYREITMEAYYELFPDEVIEETPTIDEPETIAE